MKEDVLEMKKVLNTIYGFLKDDLIFIKLRKEDLESLGKKVKDEGSVRIIPQSLKILKEEVLKSKRILKDLEDYCKAYD